MPRHHAAPRDLEHALDGLVEMYEQGTLPPILEPLLDMAPPRGMRAQVELHRGGARVIFMAGARNQSALITGGDPILDLLEVLVEAERNPALQFVALKFLRDRLLPQTRYGWAQSQQSCQGIIAEAIDRGILLTSKKPNPRNPEFPVTAVQLNREHPDVLERLDKAAGDGAEPIEVIESSAP